MLVELSEAKNYLRVDTADDDDLISQLITTAEELGCNISRMEQSEFEVYAQTSKTAVLYAVAYLYENRENPDFNKLNVNLRAMLAGIRKEVF